MTWLELKIPPLIVTLVIIALMYFTKTLFPTFGFPQNMATLFALLVLICALVFILMAIKVFREHKTTLDPRLPFKTTAVVETGIFGVTRNPMYVGMIMIVGAVGLYWQHSGFIIFVAITMMYLHFLQVLPEEHLLIKKHGEQYKVYQDKVPRWF